MSNWKEKTLSEYCEFQEGYVNPPKGHSEYFGGDIKWCRAVDINNGYVYSTSQTLTDAGFNSAKKSAVLFKPNTIVITKSGTIGRLGIIKDYMCGNRATINIIPKNNADVEFVFYLLRSRQNEFFDLAVGSVQKNLYVSILEKMMFKFPSLYEQKKIASFFSVIDKKIDINNRINCEFGTISELCHDLLDYAKYYTDIVFKRNDDVELRKLYGDIVDLRMEVSYPFLLKLHHDCCEKVISKDELKEILRLCISYVLRRGICDIPTNSMNKTFATFKNFIRQDDYLNSVKAHFILQDTYKEFPDDGKFGAAFVSRDIYNMRVRNYILTRLENYDNKAPIVIENYTIEHIMPQNKKLSTEWQRDLGDNWESIQKRYLHTIGNLTLTAYNSEMSDKSFIEKMNMEGGFKESALRLNKYILGLTEWNESHIQERARLLAEKAEKIWPYPSMNEHELAPYEIEEKVPQKYSLDTYDTNAFTKILFTALDKRIMNLSPEVKREYKKLYVAYKLDTNFVDIVFQKQRLRISINMKFSDIVDPEGICKDVTGLGRWGNGDVELFMEHNDELDTVMEIIEQSYNAQAE